MAEVAGMDDGDIATMERAVEAILSECAGDSAAASAEIPGPVRFTSRVRLGAFLMLDGVDDYDLDFEGGCVYSKATDSSGKPAYSLEPFPEGQGREDEAEACLRTAGALASHLAAAGEHAVEELAALGAAGLGAAGEAAAAGGALRGALEEAAAVVRSSGGAEGDGGVIPSPPPAPAEEGPPLVAPEGGVGAGVGAGAGEGLDTAAGEGAPAEAEAQAGRGAGGGAEAGGDGDGDSAGPPSMGAPDAAAGGEGEEGGLTAAPAVPSTGGEEGGTAPAPTEGALADEDAGASTAAPPEDEAGGAVSAPAGSRPGEDPEHDLALPTLRLQPSDGEPAPAAGAAAAGAGVGRVVEGLISDDDDEEEVVVVAVGDGEGGGDDDEYDIVEDDGDDDSQCDLDEATADNAPDLRRRGAGDGAATPMRRHSREGAIEFAANARKASFQELEAAGAAAEGPARDSRAYKSASLWAEGLPPRAPGAGGGGRGGSFTRGRGGAAAPPAPPAKDPLGGVGMKTPDEAEQDREAAENERRWISEREMAKRSLNEMPDKHTPEYQKIHKMLSVLRGGNQTGIIFALCQLQEMNLSLARNQMTVLDVGGVGTLVQLLWDSKGKLRVAAMDVLLRVSSHVQVQYAMATDANIERVLALMHPDLPEAGLMNNKFLIRKLGGVVKLVQLLRVPGVGEEVKEAAALALAACCHGDHLNRTAVRDLGGVDLLVSALRARPRGSPGPPGGHLRGSVGSSAAPPPPRGGAAAGGAGGGAGGLAPAARVQLAVARVLKECVHDARFRKELQAAGGMQHVVQLLARAPSEQVGTVVAHILEVCGRDALASEIIDHAGGVVLLLDALPVGGSELRSAAAAALASLTARGEAAATVFERGGVQELARLLVAQRREKAEAEAEAEGSAAAGEAEGAGGGAKVAEGAGGGAKVAESVLRALLHTAQHHAGAREAVREAGALEVIVPLLARNDDMVTPVAAATLAECLRDPATRTVVQGLDGVRLLWTCLKSENRDTVACAAVALGRALEDERGLDIMERDFVGKLHMLVNLAYHPLPEITAGVCCAIASCARRFVPLQVLTEDGVLPALRELCRSPSPRVRAAVSRAIAATCCTAQNARAFGELGGGLPLLPFIRPTVLGPPDAEVLSEALGALQQLLRDRANAAALQEHGVVGLLISHCGSEEHDIQDRAAGALCNMRRFHISSMPVKANPAAKDTRAP